MSRPARSVISFALLALLAWTHPASAADDSPRKPDATEKPGSPDKASEPSAAKPAAKPAEKPTDKLSWLLASEEDMPDPPIVQARAGAVLWPYLRTSVRYGRKGDIRGRDIEDLEENLGLPDRWVSPYFEATAGTSLRGGVSILDLDREGDFTRSDRRIDVGGGRILAEPGDYVSFTFHYTHVDLYAQYDVFRSPRLRIGLVGGGRILRLASRVAGIQTSPANYQSIATNDWVASPLVGGQIEIEPVSSFTVFTSIRFIDWSWKLIGLHEERAFEIQVGLAVSFIEDILSAAMDFRFLSVFVDPTDANGGKNIAQYALDAGGIGLTILFKY